MFGWEQYVQAIIAVFVITSPPDPVKILFFNSVVEGSGSERWAAAGKVAFYFLVILGVSALIGRFILEVLNINLDAFSAVGGLVIALMGFEMLYGGEPSRAQGQSQYEDGPTDDSGLMLPLATPLLAGPGAIVTVISISALKDSWEATVLSLVAVGVVTVIVLLSFAVLGGAIAKLSDKATQLLMRLGGILLATIGVQMMLGGLKGFFAS